MSVVVAISENGGESQHGLYGPERSYGVRGVEACNLRTQIRMSNSVRGRGGDETFSRLHKGGRLAIVRVVCKFIHSVLTEQSKPNPLEAKVEVWV